MNKVYLYKRPNKQLELVINGLVVKDDFTSEYYDATTRSEIDSVIQSADGINRLDSEYLNDDIDMNITFKSYEDGVLDTDADFDGTFQYKIVFIDQT